ncbi:MAG TPA: ATP-binding protein [Pseudonocardiaceae bacterium]|jgi:hypothetical protein|nr:ATP-binding protein [Pseudonocardiaceae bacterium]
MLSRALRIVIVNGPRQSGKTTLLRLFRDTHGGSLRSLDEPLTLAPALNDPIEFARQGEQPIIIDEVQRGGDPLVLAIKYLVDQSNDPGQYVLAGSTRFLTIPTLSESLAGRAAFVDLWPFAGVELAGITTDTVAIMVNSPRELLAAGSSPWSRADYLDLICTGGYPEAIRIPAGPGRWGWFEGYLQTVIQRDVRQFADIKQGTLIPRLLSLLVARTGSPAILADLARTVGLNHITTRNYLSYLDIVFLTMRVPAWSTSLTTKTAKTAKTYVTDTGIAAYLMGVDAEALRQTGHPSLGPLVETLVATELTKLLAHQDRGVALHYFRDRDGREIDFILETRDGRIIGIEVKATSSVTRKDFRHLAWLRDKLGDRFTAGIVFHLGAESYSFGDRLQAVPVSALWEHAIW